MQIRVITDKDIKLLNETSVGELLLCEDGNFYPIKSILITSEYGLSVRTSNYLQFTISKRCLIKTSVGFKRPKMWDTLEISETLKPIITKVTIIDDIQFFYDILIEKNPITPEGVVFKFGEK